MMSRSGSYSGSKRRRSATSSEESTARKRNVGSKDLCMEMAEILRRHAHQRAKYLEIKARADRSHQEIVECMEKMRAVPGMTTQLLVAGVGALRTKEDRAIVYALEGEELLMWVRQEWARNCVAVDLQLRTQTAEDGGQMTKSPYPQHVCRPYMRQYRMDEEFARKIPTSNSGGPCSDSSDEEFADSLFFGETHDWLLNKIHQYVAARANARRPVPRPRRTGPFSGQ